MADVQTALAANRDAVRDLIAAAEKAEGVWTVPRAPGKWSPSQVVEHVARALEESAHLVSGEPTKFPTFPPFVRPLIRVLLFKRVVSKGAFPKAKTNKAMNPASGPTTPAHARVRLETAFAEFDKACRKQAPSGMKIESATFGPVSVADYVRFQEVHTRHHCKQMPGTA